jgi:hypothetical protein
VGGGFGGAQNYAIEAFDPFKMIPVGGFIFYYHLAGDLSPSGSSLPRRFVSVGSEGFATVFPSYNPGDGRGGVYFFPLSIIQDRPGVPIPPPQPRNDAIRQIPVPAEGAAVDPVSGKVYLSIPSAAGKIGNTIAPFDPNSGLFDEPIWVGSDPRVSRVTPDGQYLYVHLFGSRTVKRFRLPGLEFDLEFPVIDDSGFTTNASAILNVPNAPSSTIAVERTAFGPTATSNGVAIYDDGVRRPKTSGSCDPCTGIEAGVGSNSTQFSSSGSHLFAIDSHEGPFFPFSRWFLTPEGLVIDAKKVGLSAGYLARLRCAQSVCVTSSGVLFDPYKMERIRMFGDAAIDHAYGSFASNTLVALDAVGNRVFFLVDGDLRSYELSTGKLNGTLPGPFPGVDLQILPSGDVMILGFSGVVLIPERQLP